ncbi:MAG: transcriptional coactivator p15/PC4 family protein [Bradyrhizobium sp.]
MAERETRRAGPRDGVSESGLAKRDGAEAKIGADNPQRSPLPTTVATFDKNRREKIRITLSRFEEIDLVDVRCFAGAEGDIATKKGVSIRVALLPKLIEGLLAAEAEARDRGLIGGDT